MKEHRVVHGGWIEVIAGSMFSGKTEELIRRLRRSIFARQRVQVFKPKIDDRYSVSQIASHNQSQFPSLVIERAEEILLHLEDGTDVVGIDEGQFFDQGLVPVCQELAARGMRVIVAGLDTDWKGLPFEPIPSLMAVAEIVDKPRAICVVCGTPATRTQKTGGITSRVEVGGGKSYEARCRAHFRAEIDPPTLAPNEIETNRMMN